MAPVLIRGEGIAASCCSHLLSSAGMSVSVEKRGRPRLPAIMVGEATQKLLRDVFRARLFDGLPKIRRRIVAWGRNAQTVTLPHSAIVVSEDELWARIRQVAAQTDDKHQGTEAWTIFASGVPPYSLERHFGSRMATASSVKLRSGNDPEACWIESAENGWLFLLPAGNRKAWLLSVGDSAASLLEASRLVRHQIAEVLAPAGSFPSHPRASFPMAGTDWMACGTGAIAFDPLCGDGTGNAVREAILASAIIRAAQAGVEVESLSAFYQSRLVAGLQRHLALCLDFYRSGNAGPWWSAQLGDIESGLNCCRLHIRDHSGEERQKCEQSFLSQAGFKLLTHFINDF